LILLLVQNYSWLFFYLPKSTGYTHSAARLDLGG
jgi:hypothetical protein